MAEKSGRISESLEQRSLVNQWITFANATLGPGLFPEANRESEMSKLLPPLNQILEQHPFLLGEFTVADVAVGSVLAYAPMMLGINYSDYPAVQQYVKRLSERPAFQKAIGEGGS